MSIYAITIIIRVNEVYMCVFDGVYVCTYPGLDTAILQDIPWMYLISKFSHILILEVILQFFTILFLGVAMNNKKKERKG